MLPDHIKYEEVDRAHSRDPGKLGEVMQWLMTKLGFVTEFEDEVETPEDFGTRFEFSQKEIVESIGLNFRKVRINQYGRIYVPDSCLE